MRILLTNDDGVEAIGIASMRDAVQAWPEVDEVIVVAPKQPLSGVSHRVTTERTIEVHRRDERCFAVDGTPADCVRLGLSELACEVDWVFSGVNDGGNLGADIHMSGTVAAARESALLDVPAIAWSQYVRRPEPIDWTAAQRALRTTWERLQNHGLGKRDYWNVNFPHHPPKTPSVVICSPDGNPLPVRYQLTDEGYHYQGSYADRQRTRGRDVDICFNGGVAVSKLSASP